MLPLIVTLVLTALAVQHFLLSRSLRDVTYDAYPSRDLVEPDEEFELISEVCNHKRLPELYISVTERLPRGAVLCGDAAAGANDTVVTKRFYMLPRQKVASRVRVALPQRGSYMMHGATVHGGDFLGLRSKSKDFPLARRIVVLPKRMDALAMQELLGGFLGDISVRRFILPDPVLSIGVREYTGREPMRDIHWAHSAHAGRLMVKQYDYTLEPAVKVVLNTEIHPYPPRYELVEDCLSITRAVLEDLERHGVQYGFVTNAISAFSSKTDVGDGLGQRRLNGLLGSLGCATYSVNDSFMGLIRNVTARAEQGRCHIVITPEMSEEHRSALGTLRAATGSGVFLITPSDCPRIERL